MNRYYERNRCAPKSIGVFGLHPHAGVTWVTVLLAQYLTDLCGQKVAVIEQSQKSDLTSLCTQKKQLEEGTFEMRGVTYYVHNEKPNLRDKLFEYYFYDLGCNYAKSKDFILSCDHVILLYTMTPWYFDECKASSALRRDYGDLGHFTFVGNMVSKQDRRILKKLMKDSEYLEYEPNRFQLSRQNVQVFHNIIWN